MALPNDHPFAKFNKYFYMESGTKQIPIYLYKIDDTGFLIEMFFNDFENGPRARIYSLIFSDEYNFELDKNIRNITRRTTDALYSSVVDFLDEEIRKYEV